MTSEMAAPKNPDAGPELFSPLRDWAPPEALDFLSQVLVFFPEEFRFRLKQVLASIPAEGDPMQKVLELVREQWRNIQSEKWVKIAIVGPDRTGKASLLKALLQHETEPVQPIFSVFDFQGLDEFLGYERRGKGREELAQADLILLILDARFGLNESTRQMFNSLKELHRPVLVILNKIDLVEHPGEAVKSAKQLLKTHIFTISVFQPQAIYRLLKLMVAANPDVLFPLCRNFPEFRRGICKGIVSQSALASATVGAIPIPVSDMLPIGAIQTAMLLKIARAFGQPLDRQRAKELIPMLLAGILVREGSHRLRKWLPRQAGLIAVSAAGLSTYSMGRALVRYFEQMTSVLDGKAELPGPRPALAQ